ncbi:uncharacterized protein BX664DRAFT_173499 [Halteromyces radiatus]|uniref:uncharacterized protein n=1 Tax=Halteromyces radiatus TaxID=101107 RepID=UPI00221EEFFC|nr:uncharacterized protein BX664DRAFT_173499 [Halteromyces radiatus]KAI8084834.1 hypothetical protein BX664DRAFT_173499 [Halteromyces radiatus]
MTPVHTLPYDLSSLTWNDDHTNNDQDKYCYCGKGYSEHKTMMQCSTCLQFFHSACVSSVKRPLLYGDIFYEFQCSVCTQAEEKYTREVMKWKQAVQLILYHLTKQRRLSKGKQPEHFYFRFTEEICKLVEENWDVLLWDREMNKTWKNTVASSLSTQPDLFLSGVTKWDSAGKGLWALRSEEPLSKLSSARQAPKTETTKRLKKRKPAKDELQSKKRTRSSRYDHSPVTSPEHNQETTNNDDSGSIMKDTLPTMDKENTNAALDDGALGTTTKSDDSTSDKMKTADEAIVTTKRTIVSSDDLENVADSTTDFKVDDSTVNLMKTDSQPKTLKVRSQCLCM